MNPFAELSPPYSTIVADPPWEQGDFNGWGTRRNLPYSTMTLDEIKALPVADLVEREGYLFLWVTNKFLERGYEVVRSWSFTPKQILTWCKAPMGLGLGGMFVTTTEFVIVGQAIREGTNAHGSRTKRERVPSSWFDWKRPYDSRGKPQHSAKPPAFLDLVESVAPGPYVELFARAQRLGWDSWGYGYETGRAAT